MKRAIDCTLQVVHDTAPREMARSRKERVMSQAGPRADPMRGLAHIHTNA
jgi:hypothetical protein